jgi:DNA-directed RNA polymerase subunit alpha
MLDFQIPRITSEQVEENRGSFAIEPLDRGFGYTFGKLPRRVLLSSLAGAAVTSVRIEGVAHEFSTIKGVTEDVTDIVLNLKGIVCRMHSDATEIEAPLVVTGPGDITAKDIDLPAGVEILNPTSTSPRSTRRPSSSCTSRSAAAAATARRGQQVARPADRRHPDRLDLLAVRRVAYAVEQARVGQRTDYDKLTLDIETDGSIEPQASLREAAEILISQLAIFTDADRIEELRAGPRGPARGRRPRRSQRRRRRPGRPDARHPHRGARARRPLVQLPQARRASRRRRPHLEVRGRAQRDPELRQEVDRRGHRDAARARPEPARRLER